MSTYVWLECLDHDPPLSADGESGQHLSDLPQIRADLAARVRVVASIRDGWDPGDYFRSNTARFLTRHEKCRIGIRDEYGDEYPSTEATS
ncbi:MAG: hypothetical protein JJE50_01645 [Actinomycetales bacterium]|nr:hypothetical protein [Actinomycetales bacterium]